MIRYCREKGYSLDKTIDFLNTIGTYDKIFVCTNFQDLTNKVEKKITSEKVGETYLVADKKSKKQGKTVYCRYCGEENYKDAVICPHCGRQVAPLTGYKKGPRFINTVDNPDASPWENSNMNGLFIGTILFPIVGLVAGIYGLIKPGKVGQGLSLLGLTIFISIIWGLLITKCSSVW